MLSFIYGLFGLIGSFFILKYRGKLVEMMGKFSWAERYLGRGGTYTAWIFIGIFTGIYSFLLMIGEEGRIFGWLSGYFGGGK